MGLSFGAPEAVVAARLTDEDQTSAGRGNLLRRVNASGEVELVSDGAIFRLQHNCFVEATFPDHKDDSSYPGAVWRYRAEVDGFAVLSVFDWLAEQAGTVDVARFRVNERFGIAYDYRFVNRGSYTVFAPGHWAGLIA